ncbi:hypothetical protein ACIFOC_00490 [Leucobacter aridicollis]
MARVFLARAESSVSRLQDEDAEARLPGLGWHLSFANMILLDGREEVAQASQQAWSLLGAGAEIDSGSRAAAFLHIGWAHLRHRFDPERGIQSLQFAMREASSSGDTVLRSRAARNLAFMLAWAGKINQARMALTHAGRLPRPVTSWHLNSVGDSQAAEAHIAYLANDLPLARKAISELQDDGATAATSFAGTARFLFALTAAASREPALMRRASLELQLIPQSDSRGVSWAAFRQTSQAALAEAAGQRQQAVTIARRLANARDMPLVSVVIAGILRRSGHVDEALSILSNLEKHQQLPYVRAATLATAAVTSARSGDSSHAHELLERALRTAAAEGCRRPFCEWDLELRQLITAHVAWGTDHADFIESCLAEAPSTLDPHDLSKRERVVLAQLRTTRTLPEIAEALGVSKNTVRSQVRSIYRKLGVHSRKEAIHVIVGNG